MGPVRLWLGLRSGRGEGPASHSSPHSSLGDGVGSMHALLRVRTHAFVCIYMRTLFIYCAAPPKAP